MDTEIPNIRAKNKAPKLQNFLHHKAKLRPSSKCRNRTLLVNWECFFWLTCMDQIKLAAPGGTGVLLVVKPCTNYKIRNYCFSSWGFYWEYTADLSSFLSIQADPQGTVTVGLGGSETQSRLLHTPQRALAAPDPKMRAGSGTGALLLL